MLSFFPRGVLDEILNLIESVSEEFPSYSYIKWAVSVLEISVRATFLWHNYCVHWLIHTAVKYICCLWVVHYTISVTMIVSGLFDAQDLNSQFKRVYKFYLLSTMFGYSCCNFYGYPSAK